jgi:hypothetical protein
VICHSDLKNQQGWANGPALNKQQQNELQRIFRKQKKDHHPKWI